VVGSGCSVLYFFLIILLEEMLRVVIAFAREGVSRKWDDELIIRAISLCVLSRSLFLFFNHFT
jgi:hypothetical protein